MIQSNVDPNNMTYATAFLLLVLVLAFALGPVQPASDIVPHTLVALIVGNLGRRGGTPARTAEKDDVLLGSRLGEGEFLDPNGYI